MNTRNLTVGLFMIGGTALFGTGLFLLGNRHRTFAKHFVVYTDFASVSSLESGASVRVAGLHAGEVRQIEVPADPQGKFRIQLRLDQKFQPLVRQDSNALIMTEGLVGNKYLEIEKGSGQGPECGEGCVIPSTEPFDFGDLMKDARGLLATTKETMENAKRVAGNMDKAVSGFVARDASGKTGADSMRATADSAQRAMSSLAEDAEALKHNFFLRGFFKKRGYFNLDNLTVAEYRKSKFVKDAKAIRTWLGQGELFTPGGQLGAKGGPAIDRAVGQFAEALHNNPVVVEGYSSAQSPDARYRQSLQRAESVRKYLETKYSIDAKEIGAIPLGAEPPEGTGKQTWDGVAIVVLPKK
ncbi:MAG TPA: MlaD family protein [Bryobacteraceae bacterium]|nr:MlaD family protein [Bryobacteraceae bacterium]